MQKHSRPLDNFPLLRSTKPEAVRQVLAQVYAAPTLTLRRGAKALAARMNECRLPDVTLAYGSYGADVELDFPAVDTFVHLQPRAGHAQITSQGQTCQLELGRSTIISPHDGYRVVYSGDYEGLLAKFDPSTLSKKLAAMTGAAISQPLRMSLQLDRSRLAQTFREYLPVLATTLSDAVPPLPSWWVAQTEQLLMVMFLCGHRHSYSHLLEQAVPDSAPWQVRKAEEYIEANWSNAITLEELAEVTGVSVFSLFRSFRKSRGCSPLEFATRVRARKTWCR